MENEDKKALACNYAVATKACPQKALCYLINPNPGWGGERVEVLARSRGGRWIRKWEVRWRLCNFRVKTVPPANPVYDKLPPLGRGWTDFDGASWDRMANDERGERLTKYGPQGYMEAQ